MATPPNTIDVHSPTKYTNAALPSTPSPPLEWLHRTWTVTHSTLEMWRSSRNVRITYRPLDPKPDGTPRVDDLVEYEPIDSAGVPTGKLKSVAGVDTAVTAESAASWNWRGSGLLFWVTSHWEVLGWGERILPDGSVERWVVTWFAPTLFTKEGVDVYSDSREGLSKETYAAVLEALKGLEAKGVVDMVVKDMRAVAIEVPWRER
ncbi:hypothetical protein B0T11DRAFT_290975 [Plectosphaerella cucumerina]|uniref:Uncharacterized protein n=1 Tax=Plectosphaerella cucumerina TaxID=40658 RepID=A0A8K0T3N5_9PEZI|nr:hypothetical protein B0T11DRAFT_290975 [Plectosphaerella cucumerina]